MKIIGNTPFVQFPSELVFFSPNPGPQVFRQSPESLERSSSVFRRVQKTIFQNKDFGLLEPQSNVGR